MTSLGEVVTGWVGREYGSPMNEGIRNGLGLLCVALIAFLLGLATADGPAPLFSAAARLLGLAFGVLGLVSIAIGLFRRA